MFVYYNEIFSYPDANALDKSSEERIKTNIKKLWDKISFKKKDKCANKHDI